MDYTSVMNVDDIEKARIIFRDFDDENKGEIQIQLIESAIRAYGLNPTKEDINDIQSDISGSNVFNLNTFCYILFRIKRKSNVEVDIISDFRLLDKDCTGMIKLPIFLKALETMHRPLTDEEKERLMSNLVLDNGFVDYELATKQLISEE